MHAVESVVIEWTHQIREVLKKDSAQPLLEGLNPVPYVEMEFWKVKAQNLECIYDQVGPEVMFVCCHHAYAGRKLPFTLLVVFNIYPTLMVLKVWDRVITTDSQTVASVSCVCFLSAV